MKRAKVGKHQTKVDSTVAPQNPELAKLIAETEYLRQKPSDARGYALVLGSVGMMLAFFCVVGGLLTILISNGLRGTRFLMVGLLLFAASVAWIITARTSNPSERLASLEQKIEEERGRINDSPKS